MGSRQRWSGILPRPSQARQKFAVAVIRRAASSTSSGTASCSAQEIAQKTRSPGLQLVPGAHPVALDAQGEVGVQADLLVLVAGVRGVLPVQRPLGGHAPVVEHGLADQLHLHMAVDALDGAHEHVLGVVVGRRPGVRGDLVGMVARPHGQRVANDRPAARHLPGRDHHVGAGLVGAGGRMVDAERAEPEHARLAVEQAAEDTGRVEARHAQPVDRPVRRDQRAGVAVGDERVVGDRRERRRCRRALRCGGGSRLLVLGRAHVGYHGSCQRPWPAISLPAASGPHVPVRVRLDGGGVSSSGCMIRHCLLDAVLPGEAGGVTTHRGLQQHLVGRRALAALRRRTPCRA